MKDVTGERYASRSRQWALLLGDFRMGKPTAGHAAVRHTETGVLTSSQAVRAKSKQKIAKIQIKIQKYLIFNLYICFLIFDF